jgi:hypothetical protein
MRARRREAGQSTPLVMSVLFALTLFAAVVVDVGQAVNRRVALQLTADAGAYTGASVMATGLNQMAYWNKWMQRLWSVFSWAMFLAWDAPPGLDPLPCAFTEFSETTYKGLRTGLEIPFQAISHVYTNYAYVEAKRVTTYNAIDLFPDEAGIVGSESSLSSFEGGNIPLSRNTKFEPLVDVRQVENGTWPSHWTAAHASTRHEVYECKITTPPFFKIKSSSYNVWYEKTPKDRPDYFVWIVYAPPAKALMFDSLFGGNIIPEMWAAAAAKPVGGSIAEGDSSYVAKMVPLSEVLASNRIPGLSWVPAGAIWDDAIGKPRLVFR